MSENHIVVPSMVSVDYNKRGKIFVVSAPSGAGKTTVVTALLTKMAVSPDCLERVITYTTKTPRLGEQDGIDYHFVSVSEFEGKIQEGFFIEWSQAYGHYYGSPRSIMKQVQQGTSFIMILDRAGARAVLNNDPCAVLIWLYTHSIEVLRTRLMARGGENEAQIVYRLGLAQQEYDQEKEEKLFGYHILNDFVENAVKNFENIIRRELTHF